MPVLVPYIFQSAVPVQQLQVGRFSYWISECIGTRCTHFPCIEIRRAARPPQKGQNGCLAVRPGWRPSGVIAEARNARPSMPDMPWLREAERAKMVFIIWMRSLLVWLARPQQCGAARNARPRALAGLQYTDDSLIYCARLQFFSPFFFSKRSKFRLSHQLF